MIQLNKFPVHLKKLKKDDWDKLFNLIPKIQSKTKFGKHVESKKLPDGSNTFPCWNYAPIVIETVQMVEELNLIVVFDWMNWEEGIDILADNHFDFDKLDEIKLCQLLTCIIRLDRFSEGHLVKKFEDKTVLRIILSLHFKINHRKSDLTFLQYLKSYFLKE
ncbi:MAG TPA: DUF6508 domain-containing protein [Flavobacterium sp.]|jgi:hypothetical protein